MPKYPLKLIEWHDAYNDNHAWISIKELPEEPERYLVQTLGFEIRRDDKEVTLAMSVSNNGHVCDLFTVPLAIIVREQTFRNRG